MIDGAGITPAAGVAVPPCSRFNGGVLGFLHFNLHNWNTPEINALQAVASMLVQLRAESTPRSGRASTRTR